MELPSFHKHLKNTSTCAKIHTEHLLNAGRRPQSFERGRKTPHNQVGQKKKRKKKNISINQDGTCTTGKKL